MATPNSAMNASRGSRVKGEPVFSVEELQAQLAELQEIASVAENDTSTARMLWAEAPARKAVREDLLLGSSKSGSKKRPGHKRSWSNSSMGSSVDSRSSSVASAEREQLHRIRRQSVMQQVEDRRRQLIQRRCSFPENVLLQLEESTHRGVTEELRTSLTLLTEKIADVKQAIKQMRCDEQKYDMLVDRFQNEMYGRGLSDPSGKQRSCFLDHTFVDNLLEKNALEKQAQEATLYALVERQQKNEERIMGAQKPKIELLRKHAAKLREKHGALAGSNRALTRHSVLEPHQRSYCVSDLLDLAKKKEVLLREKKLAANKVAVKIEKMKQKMELAIDARASHLRKLQRETLEEERRKRKKALRDSARRGRSSSPRSLSTPLISGGRQSPLISQVPPAAEDTTNVVDDPTLAALASAIKDGNASLADTVSSCRSFSPTSSISRAPSPAAGGSVSPTNRRRKEREQQVAQLVDRETYDRATIMAIEREARRVVRSTFSCELLDLQLREKRRRKATITFNEKGRPIMKEGQELESLQRTPSSSGSQRTATEGSPLGAPSRGGSQKKSGQPKLIPLAGRSRKK